MDKLKSYQIWRLLLVGLTVFWSLVGYIVYSLF